MTDRLNATMPAAEVPEFVRDFAEQGVRQARDTYARMKSAAEEATDRLEDSCASAARGVTEFNSKALEALRTNVNAAFDYTQELFAAKSLTEAFALSSTHLARQFETLAGQATGLAALAQKVAADSAAPIQAGVEKAAKAR